MLSLIGFVLSPVIMVAAEIPFRTHPSGTELLPVGFDLSAVLLLTGVILISRREGYPPADQKDRRLRKTLRIFATIPLLMCFLVHARIEIELYAFHNMNFFLYDLLYEYGIRVWLVWTALSLLVSLIPLFLFLHLRGLAHRARSAHLAEHCTIVGIGASAAMIYASIAFFLFNNFDRLGFDDLWLNRSTTFLLLATLLGTAGSLFILWSLYLLIRFAIAFWLAAKNLNKKWKRDDLATTDN